jgi:hypothetical protein
MVMLAEVGVDWLKHAFITRFNEIHPEVNVDRESNAGTDYGRKSPKSLLYAIHAPNAPFCFFENLTALDALRSTVRMPHYEIY